MVLQRLADGLLAGAIWYTTRRRRCQAPALRRARHPERGGGIQAHDKRRRRSAVGNTWDGWGSIPVVFPPGMANHPCPTLRRFPFKENRQTWVSETDSTWRMISARPSYQGFRRSVGNPETLAPNPETFAPGGGHVPRSAPSRKSGSVIGTDGWRSEPPCVYPPAMRATWPNGEWGCSTRRHMLGPVRRALCLATFRVCYVFTFKVTEPSP